MDLQLKNKRVLITGSSRGIGLTIALAFAREGAVPMLVARDRGNLDKAEQAFAQAGLPKPPAMLVDLSRSGSAEELRALAPDVDILVNNAGAIPGGSVEDVSEARWREAWELKVFGYINLTRVYLPMMQARGHGVICNIIGMAGAAPRADYICGATGNAALMAFTCAVGGDSMKHGVRVFGINPSPTRSDRMQGLLEQQAAKNWVTPRAGLNSPVSFRWGAWQNPARWRNSPSSAHPPFAATSAAVSSTSMAVSCTPPRPNKKTKSCNNIISPNCAKVCARS